MMSPVEEFMAYLGVVAIALAALLVVLGAIVKWAHLERSKDSTEEQPSDGIIDIPKESYRVIDDDDKPVSPLQEYYDALERGDRKGMEAALIKNADTCPSRNSYCLTYVFCPDCPLANGGLSVQSARYGME